MQPVLNEDHHGFLCALLLVSFRKPMKSFFLARTIELNLNKPRKGPNFAGEMGDSDAAHDVGGGSSPSTPSQRLCLLSTLLQVVAREDDDSPLLEGDGLAIPEHICITIVVEMLEALAPLHACRKRHRYIRPWTVAIAAGGRVELIGSKGLEDSRSSSIMSAGSMQNFVDGAQDRWYWTPERLMGSEKDGMEMDIWAVGAIFAEMMLGSPIFYGFDPANQLFTMFKVLGFPTRTQLSYLGSGYDQLVLPKRQMHATLRDKLPCLSDEAHDFMLRLLDWCPNSRISAVQALQHPYLAHRSVKGGEARANLVQYLVYKASDLSGISQDISQLTQDEDDDTCIAGNNVLTLHGDIAHDGPVRRRDSPPKPEQLSAACSLYTVLEIPLVASSGPKTPPSQPTQVRPSPVSRRADVTASSASTHDQKGTRKPVAVLGPSKGPVVLDSPLRASEPPEVSHTAGTPRKINVDTTGTSYFPPQLAFPAHAAAMDDGEAGDGGMNSGEVVTEQMQSREHAPGDGTHTAEQADAGTQAVADRSEPSPMSPAAARQISGPAQPSYPLWSEQCLGTDACDALVLRLAPTLVLVIFDTTSRSRVSVCRAEPGRET
jgi:serine/threonine protein kinase